ncbi:MAG: galactokinase, partial [Aeromicrobium sp.]
ALLIDSREPSFETVGAAWGEAGLSLVVIDTSTRHALGDGRYAERRAECVAAANILGLSHLADAGPDAVFKLDDDVLKARTRHVITETARVRGAVRAMRANNWTQFGTMLTASHTSLKDDFAVSRMELDIAVEAALEAGALGARMTGGGFGGSVIALIDSSLRASLADKVSARFSFHQFAAPTFFAVSPSVGTREVAS